MTRKIPDESDLTKWLIQRVAQELKIDEEQVDPAERLMTMGIDSLAMIGLAGELAEYVNREIRAEILWEYDSILALARHLASPVESPAAEAKRLQAVDGASSLTVLRAGADHDPAIVIGGIGVADCVVQELHASVPVGWLQLDTPLRAPWRIRTVPRMAADFADEINDQFGSGPLTLTGFSFGGIVALELAKQLLEAGREVRLLLLEPARFTRQNPEKSADRFWRHLRAMFSVRSTTTRRFRYIWTKGIVFSQRILVRWFQPRLLTRIQSGRPLPAGLRDQLYYWEVWRSMRGYVPPRYAGEMVIAGRPMWLTIHAAAWTRHLDREPQFIPLNGVDDHMSLWDDNGAPIWTAVLKGWHRNRQ